MTHRGGDWRATAPAIASLAWGGNQFTPLLAMYREREGYSVVQVDVFLAMYVAGLVPGFLLLARLTDRHGRRPVLAAGLVIGGLASVVLAFGSSSAATLCVGRALAGVGVAVAMVVGTRWVDELTGPGAPRTLAAQRTAVTLTLGFGAGAGVAGVLSQWGPAPTVTPYAVHVGLCVVGAWVLRSAGETAPLPRASGRLRPDLRLPLCARRRFLMVVLPTAPWVFATAGLAYALVPELVAERTGEQAVAFATVLTVVTLGVGALVQRVVPWLHERTRGSEALVGMALMTTGIVLVRIETARTSLVLAVVVAAVLGASYGITVVAGLVEVRQMAAQERLPGLVGVFYSLTYVGFALPAVLAAIRPVVAYEWSLVALAVACAGCGGLVALGLRSPDVSEPVPARPALPGP
ncbi:MAG: transporter [Nocardioides sp.]|nr:transporter [Nocardioides sp.]